MLKEYLKYCLDHKNATYLSTTTVIEFICVIGDFIKEKSKELIEKSGDFTLLLDESIDERNRSEVSLLACAVDGWEIRQIFLDLMRLKHVMRKQYLIQWTRFDLMRILISSEQNLLEWMGAPLCRVSITVYRKGLNRSYRTTVTFIVKIIVLLSVLPT